MTSRGSITIPFSDMLAFSPAVRAEITAYVLAGLGEETSGQGSDGEEEGIAILSEGEARQFLNNCSERSLSILSFIVASSGRFRSTDVAALLGTTTDQLRGAWAGLTKRVRTITKDPDAQLLNWFRSSDGEWRGVMAARTVASMRTALEGMD